MSSVAALQPGLSPYGQSKADAEKLLHSIFGESRGAPSAQLVVLRPQLVVGAGDRLPEAHFCLVQRHREGVESAVWVCGQ